MADAGGPGCRVDTVESDPVHADMAESELAKPGLAEKVRVLRGDAKDVLRRLPGPYDAVLLDGGDADVVGELGRLLRPGGAPPEIKGRLREPLLRTLAELRASLGADERPGAAALARARESYRRAVISALPAGAGF
jgi:hypothetical protein